VTLTISSSGIKPFTSSVVGPLRSKLPRIEVTMSQSSPSTPISPDTLPFLSLSTSTSPSTPTYATLSFHKSDTIRLLNFPATLTTALEPILHASWPPGIQSESQNAAEQSAESWSRPSCPARGSRPRYAHLPTAPGPGFPRSFGSAAARVARAGPHGQGQVEGGVRCRRSKAARRG
ncbi:hypothetical protein L209DRAFT_800547, partial [Thermothelomyces heterothallicus CBS 203.75]